MKALSILQRISPLTRFILLGSVLEFLYLLILTITPISTIRPLLSPSGMNWPWILSPAQLLVYKTSSLGINPADFLFLILIFIALAILYLYTVGYTFHTSNNISISTRWLLLPVAGTTLFGIALLFLPAFAHKEANSYIFKSLAMLSHLINCVLIWVLLGKLAPTRRLGGTILYAWNPLALIELAGNGHNEGLLICFLLLATLLIVQQKGRWYDFLAMVFLGFAISINFITLLLAPLFIYFSVGREYSIAHILWSFCWRTIVALTIVFTLYLPFWHGSSTFLAIISSFDMQQFIHSPLNVLAIPVRWLYTLIVQSLNLPKSISSYSLHPIIAANMTVRASAMFIFALIYFYLLGKLRSFDTLLTSLCLATLGIIVLLSGQFWPWYGLWPLWIVALRRFDALSVSILLLSCTALLTYPLLYVDNLPIAIYQPFLIFGIPLIYLIPQMKRSNERMALRYDRRSETAKN